MKKKIPILMYSGVLLITFLIQAGCSHSPEGLAFDQNQNRYVIDKESATVTVFTSAGKISQKLGAPGAGPILTAEPLPPAIVHYLLLHKGSVSGLVWEDLNGNRVPDTGEPGVPGVRIFIDKDNSTTYTAGDPAQRTDADGLYAFPQVQRGTMDIYLDISTLNTGYEPTTIPYPLTLDISANRHVYDANFGVQNLSGEISGTVWDQTENVPVSGVAVGLFNNIGDTPTIDRTSTTDASGHFLFSKLPGGDYYVYVDTATLNVKYHQTPVSGTDPTQVILQAGGSLAVNFSYAQKATISGVVTVADGGPCGGIRVFVDLNNNGGYDAGEPLAVTDESCNYIFNELFPGSYTVLIQMPNGYNILASPGLITINAGDNYTAANFTAQAQPVYIAGNVFNDNNGNGLVEPTESGLSGITVLLDNNNNGVADEGEPTTLTDDTGVYSFSGLAHGDFFIRVDDSTLLHAYIPTTTPNPVHKTLAAGQTFEGAKFGFQSKLASVHSLRYPTRLSWGSDSKLYVSDHANGSVFIYDNTLNLQGELKKLANPLAVATDGSGNIYVGNQGRNNVEVYDSAGNLLKSIGDGFITLPNDIAFDRDNNIFILDSAKDTVLIYNQSGALLATIGDSFQFDYAVSIAINYRDDGSGTEIGELYVADQPNCAIQVFTLTGTYKKSIGGCGSLYTTNWDGKFAGLVAVDIDQQGYIHGLDNSLNVVQVFEPQNGAFVTSYNAYPPANESFLNLQTDISIHPGDNRVLMSNVATQSVELIHTAP